MKKIYTVILAAGSSRRLGFNKLLLRVNGTLLINAAISPFLIEEVSKVLVITPNNSETIKREVESYITSTYVGATVPYVMFVENPFHERGMSTSIKAALPYIEDADGVFFHLGDKPFIDRQIIPRMFKRYMEDGPGIIVPVYKGQNGHPVLVDIKRYMDEIKSLEGDMGLKGIIERHMEDVLTIEGDEGSIIDIDTITDITILRERGFRVEKG